MIKKFEMWLLSYLQLRQSLYHAWGALRARDEAINVHIKKLQIENILIKGELEFLKKNMKK